jgi:hypothetical protein
VTQLGRDSLGQRVVATRRALIRGHAVRSIDGGIFLERFLVAAVITILLVRLSLQLAGYPKIGGHGLHIAHLLWGGLLMLTAIVLLLALLGRQVQQIAALVGGIGFGLFLDELGKFITSNNNYLYQPAIAIIYLIFVLLFLVFRAIAHQQSRTSLSEEAYLVNALDLMKEALLHDLDETKRERAELLLQRCNPKDPIVAALRETLKCMGVVPTPEPSLVTRLVMWLRGFYRRTVATPAFDRLVVGGFALYALITGVAFVTTALTYRRLAGSALTAPAIGWGSLIATTASDALILIGVAEFLRSRRAPLSAYRWFQRAVLVSLFAGEFFAFYNEQLTAVLGLAADLIVLAAVDYMIHQERIREAPSAHAGVSTS